MSNRQPPRSARALVAFPFLAAMIAFAPGTALASSAPGQAALTITKVAGGAPIAWTATGAIQDSGTWSTQVEQPSFAGGYHFVFGTLYTTMVGSSGTFQLHWYGQDTEPIAPGAYSNYMVGTWEVVQGSGTGAYEGLVGHGAWTSVQAGSLLTFTGSLSVSGL